MVRIKLMEVLEEQSKDSQWLSDKTGIELKTIHNMANNQIENIELSIIDKICRALKCDIIDIFEHE